MNPNAVHEYDVLRRQGVKGASRIVADKYHVTPNIVRARYSDWRRAQENALPQPRAGSMEGRLGVEKYVYEGFRQRVGQPVFNGQWRFKMREAMVAGDLHAPSTNFALTERMCEMARKHMQGRKHLFIVGDIWNGDKDSIHPMSGLEETREFELDMVTEALEYLLETFDDIWMTPGNHLRKRLFQTLSGDVSMQRIVRNITRGDNDQRVHLSPYDELSILSGSEEWIATHQYQYSLHKLNIASQLAVKYQANVITFHQHHTATGRDKTNRYTCIDCGGLHDAEMMAYIGLTPSTKSVPNNGFVYLREGVGNLMTPYPTMTDWSIWGLPPFAYHREEVWDRPFVFDDEGVGDGTTVT